jgi:uncharacterized LabA/DUF88 family protein
MLFVDGENLCSRAQAEAKRVRQELAGTHELNSYYWPDRLAIKDLCIHETVPIRIVIRSFYYTAVAGEQKERDDAVQRLKDAGFTTPCIFKKKPPRQQGQEKSKKVDIKLSVDMLANAYMGNYDVAILVSGDADFVPAVREVQRLGKFVYLYFIDRGLSPELKRAADGFRLLPLSFKAPEAR